MIAAELRGGNKPSLNEALGWIGSRVDDIYGASVGRLEDVWIDPGTGAPRWLLVKEGRFGGRSTLVPFSDATAGAGHVWVPYERDVVRNAPQIEPGVPLTQQVEATLRNHYAANATAAVASSSSRGGGQTRATVRLASAESIPPSPPRRPEPAPFPPPRLPHRPAPPVQPPPVQEQPRYEPPPQPVQPPPAAAQPPPQPYPYEVPYAQPQPPPPAPQQPRPQAPVQPQPAHYGYQQAAYQPPQPEYRQPPPPDPMDVFAAIPAGSMIEIELEGNLTITGELRQVRITPPGTAG